MRYGAIIALTLLFLAGCRTGIEFTQPFPPAQTNSEATSLRFPLTLKWEKALTAGTAAHPLLTYGPLVFAPVLSEGIDIIDTRDGTTYGWITLDGAIAGTPAIQDSIIYIPVTGNSVSTAAVHSTSGDLIWTTKTEPVSLPLCVNGDYVVAAGIYGTLVCMHAATGDTAWTKKLPEPAGGAPVACGTRTLVPCLNGDLYAFDLQSGKEAWRVPTGDAIQCAPVVYNGTIYAVNRSGVLIAVAVETHAVLWKVETQGTVFSSPVADSGIVVLAGTDGALRAYNPKNGDSMWTYAGKEILSGTPLINGASIVAATMYGRVFAVDRAGALIWADTVPGRIRSAPVIADSVLCVVTDEGVLYGFGDIHE